MENLNPILTKLKHNFNQLTTSTNDPLISTILSWLSTIPNLIFSLLHKLNQAFPLSTIHDLIFSLPQKVNSAFPPETRAQCLAAATPFLATAATILLGLFVTCVCFSVILNLFLWLAVTCGIILKVLVMGILVTCWWVVKGVWVTCRWVVTGLWVTCKAVCCCFGRNSVKMMKAPGSGGSMMARSAFQASPRAYFANHRASSRH